MWEKIMIPIHCTMYMGYDYTAYMDLDAPGGLLTLITLSHACNETENQMKNTHDIITEATSKFCNHGIIL